MLTLEDTECKDFTKGAIEDEDTNERNDGESYVKDEYSTANGRILRTALLSQGDDDDGEDTESQEEEIIPSEFLSIENDSEITNKPAINEWDDIKPNPPLSYVSSVPTGKEFIIITQLQPNNDLITTKSSKERSSSNKSNFRRRSRRQNNKVVFLRKILPEPIIEIKEEEHTIIATDIDIDERVPTMEEIDEHVPTMEEVNYEESSMDQQSITDSKDSVNWLQSFKALPLQNVEGGNLYLKCPACAAMFFTSDSFQSHLYNHTYMEGDSYVCCFCTYANTEPGMLFTHLSKHQNQCEFCNVNLLRKNNFEKHLDVQAASFTIKRDHQGRFVCTLCNLVFDLLTQLEKHWFKHACRKERIYQCKECSGLYDSRETLKNHKCLKCPVCGKIYDSLHRLKAHTVWAKHNLKCTICSYDFILSVDHEKHLALHRQTYITMEDYKQCLQAADGKTFQCNLCDKIFYNVSPLLSHLLEEHSVHNTKKEVPKEPKCNNRERDNSITEALLLELKKQNANFVANNNVTLSMDKIKFENMLYN